MAAASRYANITFAVFAQYSDGDGGELYSLKEIFGKESNPDNFKYVIDRTISLKMTDASLIQYSW